MTRTRRPDVKALIRAAQQAGLIISGVDVSPDGTVRLITQPPALDSAYDAWKRSAAR
jgi:hypothetical protein